MKSFDDALNEHKRLLTESLINFDEGQRVRKIMLNIDSNSADYEYYFQAGQQSKQNEIDGQFIANCKQTDHIHKLQREKDELRKRIDDLDEQLFVQKGLNRFLKGKSNDN